MSLKRPLKCGAVQSARTSPAPRVDEGGISKGGQRNGVTLKFSICCAFLVRDEHAHTHTINMLSRLGLLRYARIRLGNSAFKHPAVYP